MPIEPLDNLEPRAFLEKAQETPYTREEKAYDMVTDLVTSLLADVIYYFIQPLVVLKNSYEYLTNHISVREENVVITSETIARIVADTNDNKILKAKLTHMIEATERLSKKMGLGKVEVVISPSEECSAFVGRSIKFIILNTQMIGFSNEAIEFVIAHELAHLQHHDMLKLVIFEYLVLACSLIAFRYVTVGPAIGIGILTSMIAGHFNRTITIQRARAADDKALQCINSNKGMLDYLHEILQLYYKFKHMNPEEIKWRFPIKTIKDAQDEITPHGNLKYDFINPPTTERIAHALNFKPI